MEKNNLPRWFKSKPIAQSIAKEKIDRELGIIKDVVMLQVGEAKGHGVHLEQSFIDEIIAYDQKHFANTGLKARFGHPALSDTAMGTQLGVFKNFRVEDNKGVADLHLLDSANDSPKYPQMREWVLSIAKERPDFLMSSIVFSQEYLYQYDENNEQVILDEYDQFGNLLLKFPDEKVFVKFGQHYYTDLVEAGAATDSLFSNQFNADKYAIRVVDFVQDNPDLHQFIKDNPAKLVEFCDKLGVVLPKPKVTFGDKITAFRSYLFGDAGVAENVQQLQQQLADAQQELTDIKAAMETAKQTHLTTLQAAKDEHSKALSDKDKLIAELRERVPAGHTDFGGGDTGDDEDVPAYVRDCPVTQAAIKRLKRK